jgi:DNA-binding PadR family transcriptional regulator
MKLTVSTSFPAPPMYAEERERSDKKLKAPEEFYTITDKGREYLDAYRRNQPELGAYLR